MGAGAMNPRPSVPQGRRALVALLACLDLALVALAIARVMP